MSETTFHPGRQPPAQLPLPPPYSPPLGVSVVPTANDALRVQAFNSAVALGGSGDAIIANSQLFLAFLSGHARSIPPQTVEKLATAANVTVAAMFA